MCRGFRKEQEKVGFAPSFTKKLSAQTVRPGQAAKFTVKLIGEPAPEVKWYDCGVTCCSLNTHTTGALPCVGCTKVERWLHQTEFE